MFNNMYFMAVSRIVVLTRKQLSVRKKGALARNTVPDALRDHFVAFVTVVGLSVYLLMLFS